ncbi:acetate kinase [Rhodobacter aestuarii]|uniref:Acetate kinase n=1 Tax=Rhodobacter aestuarii TaxID=453582 RepID=A0A1N7Q070_9RHOB|nr:MULTISPECIES: acetate kinase [Rhodobacter]PTV93992.1 acetate kinase [Rhodobacter aestuarii]SIT16250.1 acetate kinase [Rhodobacter aestuarii]SOC20444.1 acetate kinase [Rhodobacter sp. JA431]
MILIINCGSSSLKYQLYTPDLAQVVASGMIAKIGEPEGYIDHFVGHRGEHHRCPVPNHRAAFALMMEYLQSPEYHVIECPRAITAIGHRAVHGGSVFFGSVLVDDAVMKALHECASYAPLHNPCNIIGIEEAQRMFPGTPNVVVFDTAFHQTIPARAHMYALPYELTQEHGIRRYGFHGTSCRYVSQRAADLLNRPIESLSMVVCHLGNGVTMDAVKGGQSIDTSIGFGTFGGVPMGTRAGDFDPAIIFHLVKDRGMSLEEVEEICYKKSGLLGLSGLSNDMREVSEAAAKGNARCQLAVDVFVYHIRKTIGAYAAAMGGLDALVFTAGIGENSAEIRAKVCEGLGFLGVEIDPRANEIARKGHPNISAISARAATLVVPTDEEKMIAIDTVQLTMAQPGAASVQMGHAPSTHGVAAS